MGLSPRESQLKREAYARGESNDLSGLPDFMVEKLQAERAKREELRKAFDEAQKQKEQAEEQAAEARYLASGGTAAGWQRDKARVLGDLAVERMRRQSGSLISPAEFLA